MSSNKRRLVLLESVESGAGGPDRESSLLLQQTADLVGQQLCFLPLLQIQALRAVNKMLCAIVNRGVLVKQVRVQLDNRPERLEALVDALVQHGRRVETLCVHMDFDTARHEERQAWVSTRTRILEDVLAAVPNVTSLTVSNSGRGKPNDYIYAGKVVSSMVPLLAEHPTPLRALDMHLLLQGDVAEVTKALEQNHARLDRLILAPTLILPADRSWLHPDHHLVREDDEFVLLSRHITERQSRTLQVLKLHTCYANLDDLSRIWQKCTVLDTFHLSCVVLVPGSVCRGLGDCLIQCPSQLRNLGLVLDHVHKLVKDATCLDTAFDSLCASPALRLEQVTLMCESRDIASPTTLKLLQTFSRTLRKCCMGVSDVASFPWQLLADNKELCPRLEALCVVPADDDDDDTDDDDDDDDCGGLPMVSRLKDCRPNLVVKNKRPRWSLA